MNVADRYKVYILTAIRCLMQVWKEISAVKTSNCWRKTGLLNGNNNGNQLVTNAERDVARDLKQLSKAVVPKHCRIPISEDICYG